MKVFFSVSIWSSVEISAHSQLFYFTKLQYYKQVSVYMKYFFEIWHNTDSLIWLLMLIFFNYMLGFFTRLLDNGHSCGY